MALEELIALENIICVNSKVNLKATYTILNMKLTKLFDEVITEVEKGILPLLEIRILFYTLKSVVFSNEIEGNRILFELCKCIDQHLFASDRQWCCDTIRNKILVLYNLITHDIIINGSLIWYMNEKVEWELESPIYCPLDYNKKILLF